MENRDVALLRVSGVSKSFTGVAALIGVDLAVRAGTVHALMGENGAGKSTLMKILSGLYRKDSGEILFDGEPLGASIHGVLAQGISMIYQELSPIDAMTVAENIFCGKEPSRAGGLLLDRKKMIRDAARILGELRITAIDPRDRVASLSIAQKQLLEIAKAFANRSRLIILDEPTSAISEKECGRLFGIINGLKAQGMTFIYITHKIDEVFAVADEVTVLRDGKLVGTRSVKDVTRDEIVKMMVGRELTQVYPKEPARLGETLLEVEGLTVPGVVEGVSFQARAGEILGFAGLMGAGRSQTMEALFGVLERSSGAVRLRGREVDVGRPSRAIRHGMAFLTEDRREKGCFLDMDLYNNVMVLRWDKVRKAFGLSHALGEKICDAEVRRFSIRAAGIHQVMRELSGGNQQKALLARWLLTEPDVFIMDEPTRGIDVGSKYEIYKEMVRLVQKGKCIIMVSSEMPEILGMSDRIVVMRGGKVSAVLDRADATQESILGYASGMAEQRKG